MDVSSTIRLSGTNLYRLFLANLDTALMHFMQDWFPKETKEKAKSNERESAEEQLAEMGINPDAPCVIA